MSSNKKVRIFVSIFFFLLIVEIAIGIADLYLRGTDIELLNVELRLVTTFLVSLFSIPIRFVRADLPFYGGGVLVSSIAIITNILIQTFLINWIYSAIKKK